MQVQDLMTSNVFCVRNDQSLNDAAQLMWEHNCGSVPVVDGENRVVGMITDRDIAMAAYIKGSNLGAIPVSTAQSKSLTACELNDDVATVEHMMQSAQLHRIPVLGQNFQPLGIVSLNDLALAYKSGNRSIKAKDLCDTLAAICSPTGKQNPVQAVA
jgi:CBS domain-containing protein